MFYKTIVCLIIMFLFASCTSNNVKGTHPLVANTDVLQFRTDEGKIITINRQNYNDFSFIHPVNSFFEISKVGSAKYNIPIIVVHGFSEIIQVEAIGLNKGMKFINFVKKDLEIVTNDEKTYVAIWSEETFYRFKTSEMAMGNSVDGYMISGFSKVNYPLKLYLTRAYFLNSEGDKVIKFTGMTIVEPESEYYNNFEEIKNYFYDQKIYYLSVKFK